MKAVTMTVQGLKCDAPGCDYRDDTVEFKDYKQCVDKPCPKCGAPLLTKADYDLTVRLHRLTTALNLFYGIFRRKEVRSGERRKLTLKMNGTGSVEMDLDGEALPPIKPTLIGRVLIRRRKRDIAELQVDLAEIQLRHADYSRLREACDGSPDLAEKYGSEVQEQLDKIENLMMDVGTLIAKQEESIRMLGGKK